MTPYEREEQFQMAKKVAARMWEDILRQRNQDLIRIPYIRQRFHFAISPDRAISPIDILKGLARVQPIAARDLIHHFIRMISKEEREQ